MNGQINLCFIFSTVCIIGSFPSLSSPFPPRVTNLQPFLNRSDFLRLCGWRRDRVPPRAAKVALGAAAPGALPGSSCCCSWPGLRSDLGVISVLRIIRLQIRTWELCGIWGGCHQPWYPGGSQLRGSPPRRWTLGPGTLPGSVPAAGGQHGPRHHPRRAPTRP